MERKGYEKERLREIEIIFMAKTWSGCVADVFIQSYIILSEE